LPVAGAFFLQNLQSAFAFERTLQIFEILFRHRFEHDALARIGDDDFRAALDAVLRRRAAGMTICPLVVA
jgi:hypothetical protein